MVRNLKDDRFPSRFQATQPTMRRGDEETQGQGEERDPMSQTDTFKETLRI